MTDLLIENAKMCLPHGGRQTTSAWVSGGQIVSLGVTDVDRASVQTIDAGGRLLTPGLIDLHTHGNGGYLFEENPEALCQGVKSLARLGVSTVLPTLYRSIGPDTLDQLSSLVAALDDCDGVRVPGFHFEGPFLKLGGAGALTLDGDIELLEKLLDRANGRMASMSISPDTKNIVPVIQRLHVAGVKVFITHTQADVPQTRAAIEAGATHATHFYDVFPAPPEIDPGVRPVGCVETILANPKVSVDFIADGVHVDPMAIRMAIQAKPRGGVIAVTDANPLAGRTPGVYDTAWGVKVRVDEKTSRIEAPGEAKHGGLAGSTLTMPRAIANLRRWLDLPEAEVWAMGSANPARAMGWVDRGVLKKGADADLVLWDESADGGLTAWRTWVSGRCVFAAPNPADAAGVHSDSEPIDV